jgi:hypothetical protein
LNAHGQLGLGHTDSIHLPMLLKDPYADQETTTKQTESGVPTSAFNDTGTEYTLTSSTSEATRPPLHLKDISAYGLASAGVRADGRVLTWGLSKSGRLGHGPGDRSVFEPKLVDYIAGQKISMVHMSNNEMIAFAPTTLVKLDPTAGPIQGNSRFSITGSGLWASDKIVVKFEPIPSETLERMYPKVDFEPFTRARSTIGKFHYDPSTGLQSISCRTPNLADTQKALKKYLASANFEIDKKAAIANNGGNTSSKNNNSDTVDPLSLLHPPHPQPMTISVSMNGIDFVPVGEQHHDKGNKKSNDPTKSFRSSVDHGSGGGGSRAKRGPVVELRNHGIGPELKHRALYNFYSMAPFQLTSVHPRLLTLPSTSATSVGSRNLDPPVYLYIGGVGLYETSSISVRLTAPGKKAIVCNTADIVFLRKEDGGGGNNMSSAAAASDSVEFGDSTMTGGDGGGDGMEASQVDEMMDGDEGSSDVSATGLYVRLKVNDAIRELDESGRLPFETSSIAVALNGQDFVSLQGHRDENSVMFYRARLDTYTPSVVPAIAPPDTKDADTSYGVPITVKGSGFFRVANRASCNGNIWHLRLTLTDPLPKSKEDTAALTSTSGGGLSSFDQTSNENAAAAVRRRKKLGPDVLVPCRYEDVNTLTALLPPFPLRSSYLSSSNKRRKPKGGVEKWPKPWPSLACFQVEVVLANDDAKLLKLWESKLNSGIEPPSVVTMMTNNNSNSNNESVALTTEEVALNNSDHLTVYSLPGMGPHWNGTPSFTLSIASGHFGSGKLVELVTIDPNYNLFNASKCLVRFAFTNKDGSKFIRDGGKKANTKSPQLVVEQAEAALLAAQELPEIEEDNLDEDDDETLEYKAQARQARIDKIEQCELELEVAQKALEVELENAAAEAASNKNENSWFVDVPAVVEQITYSPETTKAMIDRPGRKPLNPPKKRWVVRCRAPGLKKKLGGGTEFDVPTQTLEQCNNNIINVLDESTGYGKNGKKKKPRRKKGNKNGEGEQTVTRMAATTCFGEPNHAAWPGMNTETYARLFVSLNGTHFHEWPANALTNGEPVMPYDDSKNSNVADAAAAGGAVGAGGTETTHEPPVVVEPVQKVPTTTVFNYMFEPPVVTSVDTPKGVRPGKDMLFNGRKFDVIPGVSKVKFTMLVPIPESELNNNGDRSDDEYDSDVGSASTKSFGSVAPAVAVRRKSLVKTFQDGPCAVVPCHLNKRQQVVCEVPMMGDDVTPMRVELFLDGYKVMEIPSDDNFRSQVPYPSKPTYVNIDLQYAGNSAPEVATPPEPVDPADELHRDSDDEEEHEDGDGADGGVEGDESPPPPTE